MDEPDPRVTYGTEMHRTIANYIDQEINKELGPE
jgi:hypothetical protein